MTTDHATSASDVTADISRNLLRAIVGSGVVNPIRELMVAGTEPLDPKFLLDELTSIAAVHTDAERADNAMRDAIAQYAGVIVRRAVTGW